MVLFQSLKRVGGQFNTNCAFPAFNAARHTIWWKNLCFDQCRVSYFRRRKKCRRALFSQRAEGSFGCVLQMWSVMYHVTHISHVTHVTHVSWRCLSWPLSVAAFSPPRPFSTVTSLCCLITSTTNAHSSERESGGGEIWIMEE